MGRKGLLVLRALGFVLRGIDPVLGSHRLERELGSGELRLRLSILEGNVGDVDERDQDLVELVGVISDEPANHVVERPPVEEGKFDEKRSEAEVLSRMENGGIEEVFGLGQLGEGGERRGAYFPCTLAAATGAGAAGTGAAGSPGEAFTPATAS